MFNNYPYDEIMRNDPSGKPVPPTPDDYQAFKAWVIRTWGEITWQVYMGRHAF